MAFERQIINTNKQPVSFTFMFDHPVARLVIKAYDADQPGHVYYLRYVHLPESSANIRFPQTPTNLAIDFVTDNPFSISSTLKGPCEPRKFNVEYEMVPKVKRSFTVEQVKIVWVDNMAQTPAKICVDGPDAGVMTLSRAAAACIPQQQWAFIVNHEFQHVNFDDEAETDQAAFYEFMKQGYCVSQAFFALVNILGRSPENVVRMISMFKTAKNFNENYC